MKTVTWRWKDKTMTDYYMFRWLQFSKHFDGLRYWSYTFYWKGSQNWYTNFKKQQARSGLTSGFKRTRLTLRFGRFIVVIGSVDTKTYYKDVQVLKVTKRGKVLYEIPSGLVSIETAVEDIQAAIEKQKRNIEHLEKAYPNNTWVN